MLLLEGIQIREIAQNIPAAGLEVIGLPSSFDGVRPAIRSPAPHLGAHNREVFEES